MHHRSEVLLYQRRAWKYSIDRFKIHLSDKLVSNISLVGPLGRDHDEQRRTLAGDAVKTSVATEVRFEYDKKLK